VIPKGSREAAPAGKLGPVLQFMRLLWGLDHGLQTASKRMEARLGVTGPQRLVLRLVGRFPGISAGELARLQQIHPSTLTGILRRLQARKLLRRQPDAADARRALLFLTPKGAKVNGRKAATVEEAVERTLRRLDGKAVTGAETALSALIDELLRQAQ